MVSCWLAASPRQYASGEADAASGGTEVTEGTDGTGGAAAPGRPSSQSAETPKTVHAVIRASHVGFVMPRVQLV